MSRSISRTIRSTWIHRHRPKATTWARAEAEARKSGIELDLSKQPRTYPTRKDHTLVRLARVKGTQHALANAIAWAYFMDHRETRDEEVLAEIATQHGYAREEALQVMRDADALGETHDLATAAAEQGIQGVPFFVFDNRFAISGAQPQEVFEKALRVALGEEKLPA
jgi:predicted DsbA family dithiol-disulfide isomerase